MKRKTFSIQNRKIKVPFCDKNNKYVFEISSAKLQFKIARLKKTIMLILYFSNGPLESSLSRFQGTQTNRNSQAEN